MALMLECYKIARGSNHPGRVRDMPFIEALSKGNQTSDLRRALHCRCVRDDSAGMDLPQT